MAIIYLDRQQKHIILALIVLLSTLICGILIGHFGISKSEEQTPRQGKAFEGGRGNPYHRLHQQIYFYSNCTMKEVLHLEEDHPVIQKPLSGKSKSSECFFEKINFFIFFFKFSASLALETPFLGGQTSDTF